MTNAGTHSISRIRTFDNDAAAAKGIILAPTPKLKKEKETAQSITDKLLGTDDKKAVDFIGVTDEEVTSIPHIVETPVLAKQTPAKVQPKKVPPPAKAPVKKEVPKKKVSLSHSLETDLAKVAHTDTPSTLTDQQHTFNASDNSDMDEGVIIKDKKHKRFRLFPAIYAAMSSWFVTKKTTIQKERAPKHTVSTAESRIATITAAAKESTHAPQSDHGVVLKKITKKKQPKKTPELQIKKKEEIAAPQWGSSTEVSAPASEKKVHGTQEEDMVPEKMPELVVEAPEAPTPVEENVTPPEPSPEKEPVIKEEPKEEVLKDEKVVDTEEEPQKKEAKKPKQKKSKKVSHKKKRTFRQNPTPSRVPIYVYLMVILGASLLGIGVSVYWFTSATATNTAEIIRIPSLFTAEQQIALKLDADPKKTLSSIMNLSIATRETIQLYPATASPEGIQQPLDAQAILQALQLRAPGTFIRSVTSLTFGSYDGSEPFILMRVTNFDTAFAGMLAWEPAMSEDLSPLFGLPVTQSYDPYARTDTQIRSAFFRDTVASNKSTRLLVDSSDTPRLMYAFITPNLLIITGNQETFSAVLPLVTQ